MNDSKQSLLPNLVVIGVAKAGTTSLYHWFSLHPQICASSRKETHFLSDLVHRDNKNANIHDHGLSEYGRVFPNWKDEPIRMEATPSYYASETALKAISEFDTKPFVIISLRDPIDQLFSFYQFDVLTRKKMPMTTTFEQYLSSELGSSKFERACYSNYLERWKNVLGDNLRIMIFEEWTKQPAETMQQLYRWIGVDPDSVDGSEFVTRNATRKIRSRGFQILSLRLRRYMPQFAQNALRGVYLKLNSFGSKTEPQSADKEYFKVLGKRFAESNQQVGEMLGRTDLPWKSV